jgi:acetate kinase
LAPLHNPPALALVDLVRSLRPGLPAVACFDTAFFARLPPEAATYALPEAWRQGLGIRRYGFHGLSHAYAVRRAAELVPGAERLVTCHLGSGASLAAVARGRPVDTTMGFTPLEGLVMATRAGSVDPGALVFVLRHSELSVAAVEEALERRSGLVGLAGTPDLRAVIERADRGDATAALAFGVYLHRLRAGIAAMAAALGGIDVLVFTGGAGWRSARLRAEACAPLGFLGVELDEAANAAEVLADRVVSPPGARVGVVVVEAREDLEIAAATRAVLRARGGRGPGATECSG